MKQSSKAAGLLLEIIISIVFLACICVITIQLFFNAQQTAQHSKDKSGAIHLAQSIGDMFLSSDDFETLLNGRFGEALLLEDTGKYIIYFDNSMEPCSIERTGSFATVLVSSSELTKAGVMYNAFIQVNKSNEVLFDMKVSSYEPGDMQ